MTAGDTITLEAAGFHPGERVVLRLPDSDAVIASATAGADGRVRADVRIPVGTAPGAVSVHVMGAESEVVADVALRVATLGRPLSAEAAAEVAGDVVPPAAAALALIATVAGLLSVVGRRRVARQPIGSVRA